MKPEDMVAPAARKPPREERETQGFIPFLFEVCFGRWTPGAIALGIALGMIVGLIPKDNLICLSFMLLAFLSGSNLFFAVISIGLFSVISPATVEWADRIGTVALTSFWGEEIGSRAYEYPLVAWTDLNNTVVFGQLTIGLAFFLPLLLVVWIFCPKPEHEVDGEEEKTKAGKKGSKST